MATPWAVAIGLLALTAYHPLPYGSRNNFYNFLGDGKVTTNEHIKAFFGATHILGISHEDVAIRYFIENLIENASNWFYHLDDGSITNYDTMRMGFETRFKMVEVEYVLLT